MKHAAQNIFALTTLLLAASFTAACKRDDMADQVKQKPYAKSDLFPDQSSARPIDLRTVARDDSLTNIPYQTIPAGLIQIGTWKQVTGFPDRAPFSITPNDLTCGQQQFTIYCTPCHSYDGDGNGMVPKRGFAHPPTYHSDRLRNAPDGYLFTVITHGIGAMYPFHDRIETADRWRIVAYIRALQLSHAAPASALTPSDLQQLGGAK